MKNIFINKTLNDFHVIIPARSGSKTIRDKNIYKLCKHPLLSYSIAVAKILGFKDIYVNTDSKKYKNIAIKYGAKVPFLRPKKLSGNNSEDFEFIIHHINWLKRNSLDIPKYIIHLRPTTPLREIKTLKKAIKTFLNNKKNITSLRSAHEAPETVEKWFKKDKKNFFKPVFNKKNIDKINKPRQEYELLYNPNGYIDIIITKNIKNKNLYGNKMYIEVTPRIIEIDDDFSLKLLDKFVQKDNYIVKYLEKIVNNGF